LVNGFLEKNKDTLLEDLLILISESNLTFLRNLFPADELAQRKSSLGNQFKVCYWMVFLLAMPTEPRADGFCYFFKNQLSALMTTLNSTDPHYVRCVKPNSEKVNFLALLVSEERGD
jgi:myosin heavy subunit